MARLKKVHPAADFVDTLPMVGGKRGRGTRAEGKLVDPTEALPGSMKLAKSAEKDNANKSQAHLRDMYFQYIRLLPDPEIGCAPHKALARVFNLTEADAQLRQVELHDKLVGSIKGLKMSEVMKRANVNPEARVIILAHHAMQVNNPAQSLKALQELADYDDSKTTKGETWEDYLASLVR